ncbi:MAG: SAM-dependent methyltransferase [Rhodoferax sp.]|nr:SAM-dependent methyltransferase [Rhodoferax sp.]
MPAEQPATARSASGDEATLSRRGFDRIVEYFRRASGIRLSPSKHALVVMRLSKLAAAQDEPNLDRYVDGLLRGDFGEAEMRRVVDRLTTNETYFFREPEHFRDFCTRLEGRPRQSWRVWSAASSSGEEIYSIAMVIADRLGLERADWGIVGTDLSSAMIDTARRAIYPPGRIEGIPPAYLKRYCLRGVADREGELLIDRRLRNRTTFRTLNLMEPLPPDHGPFDAIWLRNVLIYFDVEAKAAIVRRVLAALAPNGVLYTGHSESLTNLGLPVRSIAPAVYVHA